MTYGGTTTRRPFNLERDWPGAWGYVDIGTCYLREAFAARCEAIRRRHVSKRRKGKALEQLRFCFALGTDDPMAYSGGLLDYATGERDDPPGIDGGEEAAT